MPSMMMSKADMPIKQLMISCSIIQPVKGHMFRGR